LAGRIIILLTVHPTSHHPDPSPPGTHSKRKHIRPRPPPQSLLFQAHFPNYLEKSFRGQDDWAQRFKVNQTKVQFRISNAVINPFKSSPKVWKSREPITGTLSI